MLATNNQTSDHWCQFSKPPTWNNIRILNKKARGGEKSGHHPINLIGETNKVIYNVASNVSINYLDTINHRCRNNLGTVGILQDFIQTIINTKFTDHNQQHN